MLQAQNDATDGMV